DIGIEQVDATVGIHVPPTPSLPVANCGGVVGTDKYLFSFPTVDKCGHIVGGRVARTLGDLPVAVDVTRLQSARNSGDGGGNKLVVGKQVEFVGPAGVKFEFVDNALKMVSRGVAVTSHLKGADGRS